jgi:HNH endonuclease
MPRRLSEAEKRAIFWQRVKQGTTAECWPWIAKSKLAYGYGAVNWDGRVQSAHRLAYELTYGPIAPGLHVLHNCDNPGCCNPNHLRLGSHADNMRDAAIRSRMPRDTNHHGAKSIEFNGQHHAIAVWARHLGISKYALVYRFRHGWSVQHALTTPSRHHR